jgi:hypothetical protein
VSVWISVRLIETSVVDTLYSPPDGPFLVACLVFRSIRYISRSKGKRPCVPSRTKALFICTSPAVITAKAVSEHTKVKTDAARDEQGNHVAKNSATTKKSHLGFAINFRFLSLTHKRPLLRLEMDSSRKCYAGNAVFEFRAQSCLHAPMGGSYTQCLQLHSLKNRPYQ